VLKEGQSNNVYIFINIHIILIDIRIMLDWDTRPRGLEWRSSNKFIVGVIHISVFSDVVLYGALVFSS